MTTSTIPSTRSSDPASRGPAHDPLDDIPCPTLGAAARRARAAFRNEAGDAVDDGETSVVLGALGVTIAAVSMDPAADPLPDIRRPAWNLGRRLLDLYRAEVLTGWDAGDTPSADEMMSIMRGFERVRGAIEPDWSEYFQSRLTGPGALDLVVEVAHDLRSPLTSILFLAETLQRGQSGDVNEVQRRQLGLIYGAALGLSSVTSDVMELARGGERLVDKDPAPFSVREIFESVRDIVHPIAEEKGMAVRVAPPDGDHRIGHPLALSRVLLNLTTNALKFTDSGTVDIGATQKSNHRVEFSVRDTGRGITTEALETLFQPFRRTAARNEYCFSGTGLGLAICNKLVQAMGGDLTVETRPEWGTRFAFTLQLPPASGL